MKRFVEGIDRTQSTLFPERLNDWIGNDNPVVRKPPVFGKPLLDNTIQQMSASGQERT